MLEHFLGEDAGEGADVDGSCETASDGGFIPAGSGHTTSRENQLAHDYVDAKSVNFEKTAARIGEATEIQTGTTGRGVDSTTKERAIPPLLRLDVLQHGRGSQEWASPSSSRCATVSLSAASTRAPTHLVRAPHYDTERYNSLVPRRLFVRKPLKYTRDMFMISWIIWCGKTMHLFQNDSPNVDSVVSAQVNNSTENPAQILPLRQLHISAQ